MKHPTRPLCTYPWERAALDLAELGWPAGLVDQTLCLDPGETQGLIDLWKAEAETLRRKLGEMTQRAQAAGMPLGRAQAAAASEMQDNWQRWTGRKPTPAGLRRVGVRDV